jgi:hypothetical protein
MFFHRVSFKNYRSFLFFDLHNNNYSIPNYTVGYYIFHPFEFTVLLTFFAPTLTGSFFLKNI